MDLEVVSLAIGLVLGLPSGFYLRHLWVQKGNDQVVRDLKTRLRSLDLRFERSQQEVATAKAALARLLAERQKERENSGQRAGDQAPLTVVLEQSDQHPLSKVRGIGPKMAVTLASYGINCLERLAELTEHDLSVIAASAPALAERMVRHRWKEQAVALLEHPGSVSTDFAMDTSQAASR
jgi:predicted flap endonuclease-1-like 5' DNA nuclease